MYHYVLLIPAVFAAAIPPQPSIPSSSECLQKCFSDASVVVAANDLNNFRSVAVDIETFCGVNSAVLKCGRECPEAEIPELEARTAMSSFVCAEKVEEFRLARDCLVGSPDVVESCSADCHMPEAPLRLDSSAAALVNPTTEVEKSSENCKKQSCSLQCAIKSFNKACAGTGELFRDMARAQVRLGVTRMAAATQKDNETQKKMTLDYLNSLPEDCAMLKDLDEFDKVMKMAEADSEKEDKAESTTKSETEGQIDGEVEKDKEEHAETTVAAELEPSNEPEVPVGPPEAQTPVVEGDATVLKKDKEADDVTEASGEEQSSSESTISGESEATTAEGNATTTEETTPAEPVIVIDDEKALETNEVTQGDAAPVKSSSAVLGATLTAFVAMVLIY